MAIGIKRRRPSRYSDSIYGKRYDITFVITGLPIGVEEHQVRQLAEPEGAVPDALPPQGDPFAGIPYYDERVLIRSVRPGDKGATAIFTIIYSDRTDVFFSGPGVQNTSFGRSSVKIEDIPVWELIDGPEGYPVWTLRYKPYERPVTHRIYRGVVGVPLAQAQSEFEQNFDRLRQFGSWEYRFSRFSVGRTNGNQVFAEIEFTRTAGIPEFPVGTLFNDIAIPELGGLDEYRTRGVTYLGGGGAAIPPKVEKVDGTELLKPWITLTFAVDGVQ